MLLPKPENSETERDKYWYSLPANVVLEKLETSVDGLTKKEAEKRLEHFGPNKLPTEEEVSPLHILIHQFKDPLIYVLIIAAAVSLALKHTIDSGVIMAVVFLNATIGFFQEYKAEKAMKALAKIVAAKARVIRDGNEIEIDAGGLVPGDIVLLEAGKGVPADLRVIHEKLCRADESMLTGESTPVKKAVEALEDKYLSPQDQANMLFMGTSIVNGKATGVAVSTGFSTELGKITEQIREAGKEKVTPLQKRIKKLTNLIIASIIASSIIVFTIGLLKGIDPVAMFLTAIALAVSAIPEGLPVVLTVTLAIGVNRMAKKNSIIRKLPAVETLGSCTVIGSDKTGTLTKNEMTVKKIWSSDKIYDVGGIGYTPTGSLTAIEGKEVSFNETESLELTLLTGLLCNESHLIGEDSQWKSEGDPTEVALIVSAIKAGLHYERTLSDYPVVDSLPFDPDLKYMAVLVETENSNKLLVKGAPEKIVSLCEDELSGDKKNKINIEPILKVSSEFAASGLRVLAMAVCDIPKEQKEITHEDVRKLTFTGMQGMLDPPREEAIEAVAGCKKAGIMVLMVTGDHAETGLTIAGKLGISENRSVLTGPEIEMMDDEELFIRTKDVQVYARVMPNHKMRIVKQLKRHNEIVAMTGDGVNDGPALKEADIGIAMGLSGTDVAKEASDMVLADDNFNSIYEAVLEGRVVFDNIRKVSFFLLSTGAGEVLAIVASLVMGLPLPFLPAQILWLNLVTNGLQDVALAFEPGEKDVPQRQPRPPKEGILSSLIIQRLVLVGIILMAGSLWIFITDLQNGVDLSRARTSALTTMVFFQFFQVFNSRSETLSVFQMNPLKNKFLFISVIAAFLAQLAFVYTPVMQFIFGSTPLSAGEWLRIFAVSGTVLIGMEADKLVRKFL